MRHAHMGQLSRCLRRATGCPREAPEEQARELNSVQASRRDIDAVVRPIKPVADVAAVGQFRLVSEIPRTWRSSCGADGAAYRDQRQECLRWTDARTQCPAWIPASVQRRREVSQDCRGRERDDRTDGLLDPKEPNVDPGKPCVHHSAEIRVFPRSFAGPFAATPPVTPARTGSAIASD